MMKRHIYWIAILIMFSCKTKLDHNTTFNWSRDDESIRLTLKTNGTFTLEKNGYASRLDSGTYIRKGDTLIVNPDKKPSLIDSVMIMDSTFNGDRYVEVMEEIMELDTSNMDISAYRTLIFPVVTVNESIDLAIHPDDPSFKKLFISDSVNVQHMEIKLHQDNTCKPILHLYADIQSGSGMGKSYRIYLRSTERIENYLAGYKWIMKDDKVYIYFANEDCDPTEVILTTEQESQN